MENDKNRIRKNPEAECWQSLVVCDHSAPLHRSRADQPFEGWAVMQTFIEPSKADLRMVLRRVVAEILGDKGYVRYAKAVGRRPSNFHRGLADPNSNTNRLVELNCALWSLAQTYNHSPGELLHRRLPVTARSDATDLEAALYDLFGHSALDILAFRVSRSRIALSNACANTDSIAYPHICLAAVSLLALAAQGISPREAVDHRIDLTDWAKYRQHGRNPMHLLSEDPIFLRMPAHE